MKWAGIATSFGPTVIFLFIFINIYGSIMIFNSLYEINISLVGIIHQIMYLMYQINLDLISIKYFLINIYKLKAPHKIFAIGPKLCWAALE